MLHPGRKGLFHFFVKILSSRMGWLFLFFHSIAHFFARKPATSCWSLPQVKVWAKAQFLSSCYKNVASDNINLGTLYTFEGPENSQMNELFSIRCSYVLSKCLHESRLSYLGKDKNLIGIFSKGGVLSMLEFNDFRNIEAILPFPGSICDRATDPWSFQFLTSVSLHITMSWIKQILMEFLKTRLLKTWNSYRILYQLFQRDGHVLPEAPSIGCSNKKIH